MTLLSRQTNLGLRRSMLDQGSDRGDGEGLTTVSRDGWDNTLRYRFCR